MASHERFSPPKTCPNPDRGSRLATTPQTSLWTTEQTTYGSLSTSHPLTANVEGSKNDGLLYRATNREQILIPIKHNRVRRPVLNGNGSKPCRPAKEIKAKQRRQQRGYLQQVKGSV